MKRNIYITLTLLCVLSIIFIQSLAGSIYSIKREFVLNISKEKLLTAANSSFFYILSLAYLLFFLIGIVNLVIFIVKKSQKKPLTKIQKTEKKLPISEEISGKLFFLISFILLTAHLATVLIAPSTPPVSIDFYLLLNLAIQIGIAVIILRYISVNFWGGIPDKKQFIFSLRVYSALLPILVISILINNFLTEKIGIQISQGPVIDLFLELDNTFSLFLLIAQIIIFGPIAEELFFRGFLYKLGRNKYTFIVSATATSLFFSLIHRIPQNILPLFVISIALCYVYEKTQNILAPIICHSLHNLISLSFFIVIKNAV